jgi:hypothetical protein
MDANELADAIEKSSHCGYNLDAAAMIRQQQVEIEALKNPILRAISMAFNPLTDEEIYEAWKQTTKNMFKDWHLEFARAILRKAQDK